MTAYDELELNTLGDRKTALFLIMSDTDSTFNFLISLVYAQLFNLLCEKADDVYGGRLPVHVRCLIDECANIGQIPNLEKLVATIRSREISACLVLQAQSQLKAIYKDNADTIIGNMDTSIFLGGKEPTTLKELAAALGKETVDTYNTGESRGRETSHSLNYQKLGRELMSVDELAVMDGGKCILQLRGVRPFLSNKYDITKHPNYKYTSDQQWNHSISVTSVKKDSNPNVPLRVATQILIYEIVCGLRDPSSFNRNSSNECGTSGDVFYAAASASVSGFSSCYHSLVSAIQSAKTIPSFCGSSSSNAPTIQLSGDTGSAYDSNGVLSNFSFSNGNGARFSKSGNTLNITKTGSISESTAVLTI